MKELNAMTPDIENEHSNIYFIEDDKVIKRFKKLDDQVKRTILKKYIYVKDHNIQIDYMSLPIDILETEKGFCAYIEKAIPGSKEKGLMHYSDYLNEHLMTITLEDIIDYILKVCDVVQNCHEYNIINPDMCSGHNVSFDPTTRSIYFTDFQGMQVGEITTPNINSFIAQDPILNDPKYYANNLYSKNIDLYTLAVRFFYYATKINIPRCIPGGYDIEYVLKLTNFEKTLFAECMRRLWDKNKDNLDIREALLELKDNYEISGFKQGETRRLIEKK